jgi:hypothetical protein
MSPIAPVMCLVVIYFAYRKSDNASDAAQRARALADRLRADADRSRADADAFSDGSTAAPSASADRKWSKQTADHIALLATCTYAATMDLTGIAATMATRGAVEAELRKLVKWRTLIVIQHAADLPPDLPVDETDHVGRWWAIGAPAQTKKGIGRPAGLTELWERPSPPPPTAPAAKTAHRAM